MSLAAGAAGQTVASPLDADVKRLEDTNSELKGGFAKMREQVRMEQLSLENATSVNRRLQEQFENTKSELARLIRRVGADRSGALSFQQFLTIMADPYGEEDKAFEEQLRDALRLFDADSDGFLTLAQLREMVSYLLDGGPEETDEALNEIISEVGIGTNGLISCQGVVDAAS